MLDLVDARTKHVNWRGWAQDAIRDELENREAMARKIDEAVRRMFERVPPAR